MDRSFLTNAEVIRASRNFVCIRLATYEDQDEAEFLKTVFVNRDGDLENTVFCILSPDTKKNLCQPGRGPHHDFRHAGQMARRMDEIAKEYPAVEHQEGQFARVPQMKNVRLGVNVAACDGLPVVITFSEDESVMSEFHQKLSQSAFDNSLTGRFIFCSTKQREDVNAIQGAKTSEPTIMVVQPDDFGLKGKVIKSFGPDVNSETLNNELRSMVAKLSRPTKSHRSHVRRGHKENKNWETEIPVTDPMSLRAMQRNGR